MIVCEYNKMDEISRKNYKLYLNDESTVDGYSFVIQ